MKTKAATALMFPKVSTPSGSHPPVLKLMDLNLVALDVDVVQEQPPGMTHPTPQGEPAAGLHKAAAELISGGFPGWEVVLRFS